MPVGLLRFDRQSATVLIEGAWYSVPSRWAGLAATAYIGVEDGRIVCREGEVTHPRQGFGTRSIRYRYYLSELARKPQAVRQVAPELVAELGEPYGRLWSLLLETYSELDAAAIYLKDSARSKSSPSAPVAFWRGIGVP